MATISDAPARLKAHAEAMPPKVREALSPEELRFRLEHVERVTQDADSIGNPAISRQLRAKARRFRDAKPYAEYQAEMDRLKEGRIKALGGHRDVWRGYCDAIRSLEENHPQAPGISEHLYRASKGRVPEDSPTDGKSAGGMLYKRAARIDQLVRAELAEYEKRAADEAARLRAEIAALKAAAKAGKTPQEQAKESNKLAELQATAEHFEKLAGEVTDRDLIAYYREKACQAREAVLQLNKKGSNQ